MNWYLAKLVFQIIPGNSVQSAQFDEQLRLIQAPDKDQALARAREIGTAEQETIVNHRHKLVQWKFIDTAELYRIHQWIHGAELYSQVHEAAHPDTYIEMTHHKAAQMKAGSASELLNLL